MMYEDEVANVHQLVDLQDLQKQKARSIAKSSSTMDQECLSIVRSTLSMIGNDQSEFQNYRNALWDLESLARKKMDIGRASSEDKILDVYSGVSTSRNEKRHESYFRKTF